MNSICLRWFDIAYRYQIERGRPDYAPPYLDHAESICNLVPASTMVTLTDVVYVRAELANKNRKPAEGLTFAKEFHELAAKHDPNGWRLPQSHNTLSAIYLGTGDFAAAAFHAERATAGYTSLAIPEFADWPYINKADALRLLGRYEEAIETLTEYLRLREIEGEDQYRYVANTFISSFIAVFMC
jgi:tetratricopeptide (TPR) repeat protein